MVNLAVTDVRERVIEVRCLVSGRNAGQTFDLRCEVREKMMAFLRDEHPQALPRERVEWLEAEESKREAIARAMARGPRDDGALSAN